MASSEEVAAGGALSLDINTIVEGVAYPDGVLWASRVRVMKPVGNAVLA